MGKDIKLDIGDLSINNTITDEDMFLFFYDRVFREEYDLLMKEWRASREGWRVTHNRAEKLNDYIDRVNRYYRKLFERIAGRIHQYVRENGIQTYYPLSPHSGITFTLWDEDNSLPFSENKIHLPFMFCAHQFSMVNKRANPDFDGYEINMRGAVNIKPRATRPDYRPPWCDRYDKEFTSLHKAVAEKEERRDFIKNRFSGITQDLDYICDGELIPGFFKAIFKILWSAAKAAVKALIPAIVIALIPKFIHLNFDPSTFQFVLAGLIFLGILIWQGSEDCAFDYFTTMSDRFSLYKERRDLKAELPQVEAAIKELTSPEQYREAYARNQKRYEADCALAAKWQNIWYRNWLIHNGLDPSQADED